MLRITEAMGNGAVARLIVEGRVAGDALEALRAATETLLASGRTAVLALDGVTFIDPEGAALLHALMAKGAVLLGQSGFVTELLQEEGAAAARSHTRARAAGARDAGLVERILAGDETAFEAIVRLHGSAMLATARRFFTSDDDARDVVQDACLSAFRSLARFHGGASLATWLHRIVVNAALMRLRTRRRRPEDSIEALLPRFDDQGHWVEGAAQWRGDAVIERDELRATVRASIDRLPDTYRCVLVLRDLEDLDTGEVADLLGITPNAVKVRLHRARQALRTLLERVLAPDRHAAAPDVDAPVAGRAA
ncbi:MAG: sigma-70 family RNA polymerase sigma factor [Candidatus Binatia bacterium]